MAPQEAPKSKHPFTCNTCQVAFRSSELQRLHMQTDWHRYNLKRRVASLPPLSSETFAEKVISHKETAAATAAKAAFERSCAACQKTYYSENAFENHLASQRHRANVLRLERASLDETDKASSIANSTTNLNEPPDFKPEISKEGNGVGVAGIAGSIKSTSLEDRTDNKAQSETSQEKSQNSASLRTCLFCNYISPTMSLNLTHMGKYHGTFIPEKDYLVDLEGLVQYLGDKVWTLHECLYCGKARRTAEGAQTHMRDSGHCMIAFTEEHEMLDIGQFYDFRSTYPGLGGSEVDDDDDDDEEATGRNAGVKLGAHRQEIVTVENGGTAAAAPTDGDNGDEEGWESDSSLSSVPTEEITSVPISDHTHRYKMLSLHRHHSHSDPRPHRNPDGWHSHAHHLPHAVYHDDYELHLPSGRTAGHRSLARYYRQNLHNYPTVAERREQLRIANASSSDEGGTVGDLWRGRQLTKRTNAEMSLVGLSDARKKELRAGEKKDLKKAQRLQSKYQWGNEKRANHQKHFRDHLLQ